MVSTICWLDKWINITLSALWAHWENTLCFCIPCLLRRFANNISFGVVKNFNFDHSDITLWSLSWTFSIYNYGYKFWRVNLIYDNFRTLVTRLRSLSSNGLKCNNGHQWIIFTTVKKYNRNYILTSTKLSRLTDILDSLLLTIILLNGKSETQNDN